MLDVIRKWEMEQRTQKVYIRLLMQQLVGSARQRVPEAQLLAEARAEVEAEFGCEQTERLEAARRRGEETAIKRRRNVRDDVAPASHEETPGARAPALRPVQRQAAHAESVLSALRGAGFDPLALPPQPRGRAWPAKTAARAALANMSPAGFDKTWQKLRNEGRIRP